MKRPFIYAVCALFFIPFAAPAQEKSAETPINSISLKDNTFIFEATYMYPMKGKSRLLDPGYTVTLSKDTLYGHLPYIGQATVAAYGTSDAGINIATSDFKYATSVSKKSNKITYKINSTRDVLSAVFTIYKDGTANLSLTFAQRQPISFRGNIRADNK